MRSTVLLLGALIPCMLCSRVDSQISLHTNFESAALDLQASTVNGNVVTLYGPASWTRFPDHYQWVYFRASRVQNLRPKFILDGSFGPDGGYLGVMAGTNFFYSYDQDTWFEFEDGWLRTPQPFTEDDVYIAHSIPYPYSRTEQKMDNWTKSDFVTPTISGNEQFSVGTVPNTTEFGPRDLNLFGLRISNDEATGPKTKIMLVGGNHSGEVAGNWVLEGVVDFILGDEPSAATIRNRTEIFVYPQVDPMGRVEGFYRGNSQNPAGDHNGFWSAPVTNDDGGFREIDLLNTAWRMDTDGAVDITLDFHGKFDPQSHVVLTDDVGEGTQFIESLGRLVPESPAHIIAPISSAFGISGIGSFGVGRPRTMKAMNSRLLFAPEIGPGDSIEEYLQYGQSLALSLHDQILVPVCDTNHDGSCDTLDLDRSSGLYSIQLDVGSRELDDTRRFDFNQDMSVDAGDLAYWLAAAAEANGLKSSYLPGDVNLDGDVNFEDFRSFAMNFGAGRDWSSGDFDGNAKTEFSDFLALANNFGRSSTTSVPEPNSLALLLIGWFAVWRIRTSKRSCKLGGK